MPSRVAIIGRPNVGKSTLFNRIVGRRHSITEKKSGTTRDRVSALVHRNGSDFELVDTGGFDAVAGDHISQLVKRQIEIALTSCDIVLFVCDGTEGVTALDEDILKVLRRTGRNIMLVINKVDNERVREGISEFYSFGMDELYPVSAIHNTGLDALMKDLTGIIGPSEKSAARSALAIKIAVTGRPNVGKSSFVNKLVDEERVIVHERPGTTRDSVDIHINRGNTDYLLIDTAGMRHKRKIRDAVDVYGMMRAEGSIRRSDICVVIIDAYDGLTRDDMRILRSVREHGKGCVLLVNKWDIMPKPDMTRYQNALIRKMDYIKNIPVLFTSCKTGLNVEEVLPIVGLVYRNLTAKYEKSDISRILEFIKKGGRVPLVRSGKLINIKDIRQEDRTPPTFAMTVNKGAKVPQDYIEGIKNVLRVELGLTGVPIKIDIKRNSGKKA